MGGWYFRGLKLFLIIVMLSSSFLIQGFCEELPEETSLEESDVVPTIESRDDEIIEKIDDVGGALSENQDDLADIKEDTSEIRSIVKAGSETKEEVIDYTKYFEDLHSDNQKLMISIWALFGLLLGSKLIAGMFGNG